MFPMNDALAHAIIHASQDADRSSAARYHSSLHPARMLATGRRIPSNRASARLVLAAVVRQATARAREIFIRTDPVAPACCPAAA